MGEWIAKAVIIAGTFCIGYIVGGVSGVGTGAIAAHKGEIVCVELAFEPSRGECGGL